MFSALAAGAFLLVTGVIGWNVRYLRGFFEGGRWSDGPVWWQIGLGAGLLLLGAYWLRRLVDPRWTFTGVARSRQVKIVGRGRSSGVDRQQERRSLTRGEPKT